MDEHLFHVLSRREFDGLSLDEKLAYLDLELLSAIGGIGIRKTDRIAPVNSSASRRSGERRPHSGP